MTAGVMALRFSLNPCIRKFYLTRSAHTAMAYDTTAGGPSFR